MADVTALCTFPGMFAPPRSADRPPRWLRRMAVLTSATFLWSSLLAAPAQVLARNQDAAPRWPTPKPVPLPIPHDDPAWHTIDYHAGEHAPAVTVGKGQSAKKSSANLSLLDEVGRLSQSPSAAKVNAWKRLLHQPKKLGTAQAAKLHLWLGEVALAQDEQPLQALWHFAQAQKSTLPASDLHGVACYDKAIALFYEGAYNTASAEFKHLLTANPGLRGFDRRTATLFWRHARACAGYHAERDRLGIPEPPKLDPLCGASALALALKAHHKPYDKQTILAKMRVTGQQPAGCGERRTEAGPVGACGTCWGHRVEGIAQAACGVCGA